MIPARTAPIRLVALLLAATASAATGLTPTAPAADGIGPAQRIFFEKRIRPILAQQCYECHSAGAEKIGGKLLLDSRAGILQGGESGPALVAGAPERSLLLQALRWEHDLEMPPEAPLPPAVLADFEAWISDGAPDPREGDPIQVAGRDYEEGALWSFQPPRSVDPPESRLAGWEGSPIDRFISAGFAELGLDPAPEAEPRVLVRRLHFDLVGLPPRHEEVDAFARAWETDPGSALEALVDSLLASPHFGERWGRHWLDVARYAESNGNDGLSRNPTFPHAWRYRDYVIDAWNRDLPIDQFFREQIAGDLLPADSPEERDRLRIATGFLALGAKPAKAMNNNFAMDVVADQIDVIGSGMLGVSVACARCHDHKFDPVTARDYYALAGIFTSTETMWGVAGNEKLTAPPTDLHVLEATAHVPPPDGFVETVLVIESNTGKPKPVPKSKWEPGTPLAMGVRDAKEIADAKINLKGDAKKLGDAVPRAIPAIYRENGDDDSATTGPAFPADQSGRVELANWITDPSHPQTARVFANRVWMHLFGRGLVDTPNDFGVYGSRPTHPDLLDHLALRLVENDWSAKRLIREIVLTRTYRASSETDEASREIDPDNLWLARHSRRRLDAEALRDRLLAASGTLDRLPPEGSLIRHRDILVNLADSLHEPSRHRSVYLCYLRNSPPPDLAPFDLPPFTSPVGARESSTRPGQALFFSNSPFVFEQAEALANRTLARTGEPTSRVRELFHAILLRDPDPEESYRAVELVDQLAANGLSEEEAWSSLAQSLFASNEFRYVD